MRSNPRSRWTPAVPLSFLLCFLLIGPSPALGQNTITGTVVDVSTQQPLAGAQVVIEGSQLGSLTDNRGRFLILNVPQTTVTVEVIMIGYRATSVQVSAERPAVIELSPTAIDLDEIVVTGVVGEQQARSIGNAIGKIDAAAMQEMAPSPDVQDMLSATVAGVRIMSGGGEVGTGGITRIRGVKSMTLSAQPIIVVDGVRVNGGDNDSDLACGVGTDCAQMPSRLDDFNPDEIESIEIIKGPAAATLYGTEASNGVIQIITKKGQRGAPRVNMTVRQGANWYPDVQNLWPTTFYRSAAGSIEEVNVLALDARDEYGLLGGGRNWFQTGHNQGYQAD
ncbi:MAG: TonB-dependent receptor plug domain-containing protein, partial [Gemmatimonadetes bacterium]|nr:TonB-dependent receptor plug domain-containing protein [Gemmatimonadota bacterium]